MLRRAAAVTGLLLTCPLAVAQQVDVLITEEGAGPEQTLSNPKAAARGPDGSLWVAGSTSNNLFHVATDGTVTEVFSKWPGVRDCIGLVIADDGTLYVASYGPGSVVRVAPNGTTTLAASSGLAGPGIDLTHPTNMAMDGFGNAYVVCETSENAFRIAVDGTITELVDGAGAGPGEALQQPRDIAVDAAGNVYVCGVLSDNVLQIDSAGTITQVIGPDGDGAGNLLNGASALAVGPDGSLFVASMFEHFVLRRDPAGSISPVITSVGDGSGNGLSTPTDLLAAPDGTLYVAGFGSDNVFELSPGGQVTEVLDLFGDGSGPLANDPVALARADDGTLYVASAASETIHAVGAAGVQFIADVPGFAWNGSPVRHGTLAVGPQGRLHVSVHDEDQVLRFEPGGGTTVVVDNWSGPGEDFGAAANIAIDGTGRVFVAADSVFRFDDTSGAFDVVVDGTGKDPDSPLRTAHDVLFDHDGRLVILGRQSNNVLRIEHDGTLMELLGPAGGGPGLELDNPEDMALGDDGSLYIANQGKANILALRPDGTGELLVDWEDIYPGDTTFTLGWNVVDVDPLDRVYFADSKNYELHRRDPDGTTVLLKAQSGSDQLRSITVEDGGSVLYGIRHPVARVERLEPSGQITPVLGPEGDGLGEELEHPWALNVLGPGLLDVVAHSSHDVFAVDLGVCGGFRLIPGALPSDGAGPLLTGEGTLCAGASWLVQLSGGEPGANGTLVLGFSELSVPFKGGTLVPSADVFIPILLNAAGDLDLGGTWPGGVPSSTSLWLQAWLLESSGPGYRASNGLALDVL